MEKKFDLTTAEGILAALKDIGDKELFLLVLGGPTAFVGKKALDAIRKFWAAPESTIEAQKKAAIEIIKAGKSCGAESLEVTLDQKAGIDLGSKIEGIPLKVMMGKSGNMTIRVQYK